VLFITQGRYTREAMAGMMADPEDRGEAVRKLAAEAGGRLISYYFIFGEYDFLLIAEAPDEHKWAQALLVAAATGGVTDLKTTVALTTSEAKQAFAAAKESADKFRAAGVRK
jgi:uncharacterized protein with GYD domain